MRFLIDIIFYLVRELLERAQQLDYIQEIYVEVTRLM